MPSVLDVRILQHQRLPREVFGDKQRKPSALRWSWHIWTRGARNTMRAAVQRGLRNGRRGTHLPKCDLQPWRLQVQEEGRVVELVEMGVAGLADVGLVRPHDPWYTSWPVHGHLPCDVLQQKEEDAGSGPRFG